MAEQEPCSHINLDNLNELFKQDDKLSFYESLLVEATRIAKACGRPFDSCAKNKERLEGIVVEESSTYDIFMNYIFPRKKGGTK